MSVNVDSIKLLRNSTGFGIMECKKALEDADGDIEKAKELLEKLGSLKATKKLSRDTKEGVIESYIHNGSRVILIQMMSQMKKMIQKSMKMIF